MMINATRNLVPTSMHTGYSERATGNIAGEASGNKIT